MRDYLNMNLRQLDEQLRTRQIDGWNRADFVGYERVTITHNAVNKLPLFTKTLSTNGVAVTNFETAGRVPDEVAYLFDEISMDIEPSGSPAAFGAQAAMNRTNDVAYLESKGLLSLYTGSNKQEAFSGGPLRIFPGNNGIGGVHALADTSTAAADKQSRVDSPLLTGRPFALKRPIFWRPKETYGGLLDFGDSALVLPSTANATLLIRYRGLRFTKSGNAS